jgi:LemA protein
MSKNDGAGLLCGGMLVGIAAYFWGLGQYRLKKCIEYTPTSKAISVAPGVAEVSGAVQPYGELLTAPFGNTLCVYYETRVYKWSGSGKHRRRSLSAELESDAPFYIEDDTGKVLVRMKLEQSNWGILSPLLGGKANLTKEMVKKDFSVSGVPMVSDGLFSSKSKVGDAMINGFLEKNVPSLADYRDKVEVEERSLARGDGVYLLGVAKEEETGGKPQMVIGRDREQGVFCIADGTEKNVLSSMNFQTYAAIGAGPVVFAVCFVLLDSIYLKSSISQLALPVAFLMYAYVAWTLAIEFFNGMVILKNNVERARSNVDVLLQRRSELIPNLAAIVKAAARHEQGVQEEIAMIRADSPTASKELFAIAENYPSITAAENYRLLFEELSHTETWIAGARSYVADSVMLYNNRVSSFPHSLLAMACGMRPFEQKVE